MPDLHRPTPLLDVDAAPVDRRTHPASAAARLLAGERLIVTDRYQTGAEILDHLRGRTSPPPPSAPRPAREAFERRWRALAARLLVPIAAGRLDLAGAREIGFLSELYPELDRFALPLIQAQALRGAWVRHQEGVHLAVLGRRLHPFYGVYTPTRTAHLELFATWLSRYAGPRDLAVDVGTGSGVLALLLARAGFGEVLATDVNPNAIEGLTRELARDPLEAPITCACGDLFAGDERRSDLIVFNPPWLQRPAPDAPARRGAEGHLDQALTFDAELFPRFFEQACARLRPAGRLVLIFSDAIRLLQPDAPHPIDAELARGRLRLVDKLRRRAEASRGSDGRRRRTRERVEIWELALSGDAGA